MGAISSVLSNLMQNKINDNMAASGKYPGPLAQANPSYFISMCTAIATGIADGTKIVNYITKDVGISGLPFVGATGNGIGIKVDAGFLDQAIYTSLRNQAIIDFGSTSHDPFPPTEGNSGGYLQSLSKGIADAVTEHFAVAYNLISTHTTVYYGGGEVKLGAFYGLDSSAIENLIIAASPTMQGSFWPKIVKSISVAYVDSIHNHSTGHVIINGICIPSAGQICGAPFVGAGIGIAN